MGRYSYGGKGTVEAAKRVELSWLKKQGYLPKDGYSYGNLHWSYNGSPNGNISFHVNTSSDVRPYLRLVYRARGDEGASSEWKDMDYQFPLEKTPCRFGGHKWFVRCELSRNGVYCGRRVRILYQAGSYFGCRHCADLTYESCNEGKHYRGGMFRILSLSWKADEYLQTLKRHYYRGRPTRKYRKYLKMGGGYSEEQIIGAVGSLAKALKG